MDDKIRNLFKSVDDLLNSTNLDDVTADSGSDFKELPDGYYLSELVKAELTESKTSHLPMVSLQFQVVENGWSVDKKDNSATDLKEISNTKDRKIYLFYVLKDETSLKRFVTDMLKFEGDTEGESLLSKEYFTTSELLEDALSVLVGSRIYINISTVVNKDDTESTWRNMISWNRAKYFHLPM